MWIEQLGAWNNFLSVPSRSKIVSHEKTSNIEMFLIMKTTDNDWFLAIFCIIFI